MVCKLKLKPAECHRAVQCSMLLMLCSAYVGRIGLLGSNLLFSMCQSARVCLHICACAFHVDMRPLVKATSMKTNQQSIINVTDELWLYFSWILCCFCLFIVCAQCLRIHMRMIFYSTDVTGPSHTLVNKKRPRCNLKPQVWMALL